MRHPVLLHERQAALRVEMLHQHDGPAHALRRHRPHQRGRVVERGGAQVDVAFGEAHDAPEHRRQDAMGAEGQPAQGPAHTLGVAGRARRVEHGKALDLRGQRLAREPGHELVVGRVPRHRIAHHQPQLDRRCQRNQLNGQRCQRRGRDQRAGATVLHDVGGLFGGQVRVDHRVVQAGALEPERHLMGPVVVGQQHRHVVPRPQPVGGQGLGQPARALLELGEGHDPARGGDHGGPVGIRGGVGGGAEMRRGRLGAHLPLLAQPAALRRTDI